MGRQLNVVTGGNIGSLVAAAVLVLHRVRQTARPELDHVGLAHQPQRIIPQRQRPLDAPALGRFHARLVSLGMFGLTTQGVDVVVEHLFEVNQPALARAVVPVLQG